MNNLRGFMVTLALLCSTPALATPVLKPFTEQSLPAITQARQGMPFLLVLWSVDCPPCMKELDVLQQVRAQYPEMDVVLIATDPPSVQPQARDLLRFYGLDDIEAWIFAHDYAERLRYHIDPDWFGELPRSYFYGADHERVGVSGALKKARLLEWASWVER